MLIALISETEYRTMILPEPAFGIFQFRDKTGEILFDLIGQADGWQVQETHNCRILNGLDG